MPNEEAQNGEKRSLRFDIGSASRRVTNIVKADFASMMVVVMLDFRPVMLHAILGMLMWKIGTSRDPNSLDTGGETQICGEGFVYCMKEKGNERVT